MAAIGSTENAPGTITTIAGGFFPTNVAATSVPIVPSALMCDKAGNCYVVSEGFLLKWSPNGTLTVVAGNGSYSETGDGGPAAQAPIGQVRDVATDAAGAIYIATLAKVRRIDPATQVITTVAGTVAGSGGDGGPATSAGLRASGIALDRAGNLYISDGMSCVRRVDAATGIISTPIGTSKQGFSGDGGPASAALLSNPRALAFDSAGNLYIVDAGNSRLRKVTPAGVISTFAGNGGGSAADGVPATSTAINAYDFAIDAADHVYVNELYGRIRRVDAATGIITRYAGSGEQEYGGEGGPAMVASFRSEVIAIDANGNLVIADKSNGRLLRVDRQTQTIGTIAGTGTALVLDGRAATAVPLALPAGVVADKEGNVLFTDNEHHVLRRVDHVSGIITTVAGDGTWFTRGNDVPATTMALYSPLGITQDRLGNTFIADYQGIKRLDAATGRMKELRTAVPTAYAVAADAAGNIYASDYFYHRVWRIDGVSGAATVVAGTGTPGFSGDDGPATSAQLQNSDQIAVDAAGNLFIADYYNARVRRVDAQTGTITTVAGSGTSASPSGDGGPATAAKIGYVRGIAVDAAGNLFLASEFHHRIARVDAVTGVITTVAGGNTRGFYEGGFAGDGGPAANARLNTPRHLAFDRAGNLYVADSGNNRIRRIAAIGAVAGASTVQISPTTLDFGAQAGGTPGAPKSVTMTNTGTSAVQVLAMTFGGIDGGDFAQTNNCGTRLGGGASCTIAVTFTPSRFGAESAVMQIAESSTPESHVVALAGAGTAAAPPRITSLSPGFVYAGSASFTLTVEGTNFVRSSVVQYNGTTRSTSFVSPTTLTASISAADVALAGTAPVNVLTAGSGASAAYQFFVTSSQLPQSRTAYLPHIVTGQGYVTKITITDLSGMSNPVLVIYRGQDGALLGSASYTIPAGGTVRVATPESARHAASTTRWAIVNSQAALTANLFFEVIQKPGTNEVVNCIGFNDAPAGIDFTAPVEFEPIAGANLMGRTIGVALANTTSIGGSATIRLVNADGMVLASTTASLPAWGQVAIDLSSVGAITAMLPARNFVGSITISATVQVAGIALLGDYGPFSSIPLVAGRVR